MNDIYLKYDIYNKQIHKIGSVQLDIDKKADIEKWRNPNLLIEESIEFFKSKYSEYKDDELTSIYSGEIILNN